MNIEEFLKNYYNSNKNKYGTTEDELYDIAYDVKEDFEQHFEATADYKNGKDFDTWYDEFIDETILPILKKIIQGEETIKTFNDFYKEFELDKGYDKLNKFRLYALCRYEIQDTEFDDKFIDELYDFWHYLSVIHPSAFMELTNFVDVLYGYTNRLKIDLRNIDLDELAKEFED